MKISEKKKQKISEQILSLLYDYFPRSLFTSQIASEIARDEEFIKTLLKELENKSLIVSINKNSKGVPYLKRIRWRITNKVHSAYSDNYSKK